MPSPACSLLTSCPWPIGALTLRLSPPLGFLTEWPAWAPSGVWGHSPPQIQGSTWHSVPSRRGLRCSCVTVNTFLPCRGLVSSWQSGRHKPTLEAFSRDVVRLDNFGGFFRLFGKNKLKGKFSRGENRNTVRVIGTALCQRLVGRQTADERAKHPPPPPSAPWRRSRRGVALRQRNKSHVAHPHGG